jgi:hypothetical protein
MGLLPLLKTKKEHPYFITEHKNIYTELRIYTPTAKQSNDTPFNQMGQIRAGNNPIESKLILL